MRTKRNEALAIAMWFVLIHAPLAAQTSVAWTQLSSSGPVPRLAHAMVYDIQRGRTVLYGGEIGTSSSFAVADTWEWDGGAWTFRSVAGPVPSPRYSHAMAYDVVRGRTVMFGGYAPVGFQTFGDTWEWDGTSWVQRSAGGPSARKDHAMAHDIQRNRTVLFGGHDGGSSNVLGDTWEWDGGAWIQVASAGPPARRDHAMAYDSQRGRTVLFGGRGGPGQLGNTWEWDGSTWMQLVAPAPSARSLHAMAFDDLLGKTVLFGGYDGAGGQLGDTWAWDGSTWTQAASSGPAARLGATMAYDFQQRHTVLFGGRGAGSPLGDTWEGHGVVVSSATTFGTGCGNPALTVSPSWPPAINTTARALLTNFPASPPHVAVGWSSTSFGPHSLPFSLAPFGLPGCVLLHSVDIAPMPTAAALPGSAVYDLPIPNWGGLIGVRLYLQGWAHAPGANAADTIVSNGLEWVIGNT